MCFWRVSARLIFVSYKFRSLNYILFTLLLFVFYVSICSPLLRYGLGKRLYSCWWLTMIVTIIILIIISESSHNVYVFFLNKISLYRLCPSESFSLSTFTYILIVCWKYHESKALPLKVFIVPDFAVSDSIRMFFHINELLVY